MTTTNNPTSPRPPPLSPSPSRAGAPLPQPRTHPLRAGSAREETTRRYIESALLGISRRFVKKFQPVEERGETRGYEGMGEVCADLGGVVDVLWRSGTPALQIPYLLSIALSLQSYLPAFKPAPRETFELLGKLDHAFASLLVGRDVDTGERLPGIGEAGEGGMSRTEVVRCKSLVEGTRVVVVEVIGGDGDGEEEDEEEEGVSMDVARVYEKTIVRIDEMLNRGTVYDVGESG